MHQAGRLTIYIGIALTAIGLIVGFTAMFMDRDDLAKMLIGMIPVGFVLMLAGTVTTQLSAPKDKSK
jgi:uncharacterized membrane protein